MCDRGLLVVGSVQVTETNLPLVPVRLRRPRLATGLNQSVMAKSVKSNRSGLPFVSTISTP
jgi:hypothetical protein